MGEKTNEAKKFEQYKKEARNGNAEAQYNLGLCYQYGRGVEADDEIMQRGYEQKSNLTLELNDTNPIIFLFLPKMAGFETCSSKRFYQSDAD